MSQNLFLSQSWGVHSKLSGYLSFMCCVCTNAHLSPEIPQGIIIEPYSSSPIHPTSSSSKPPSPPLPPYLSACARAFLALRQHTLHPCAINPPTPARSARQFLPCLSADVDDGGGSDQLALGLGLAPHLVFFIAGAVIDGIGVAEGEVNVVRGWFWWRGRW